MTTEQRGAAGVSAGSRVAWSQLMKSLHAQRHFGL